MRMRKGNSLTRAIEKVLGKGKYNGDLMFEALKVNHIEYDILHVDRRTARHEIAIRVSRKGWDYKKVLSLWAPAVPDPILKTVPSEHDIICLVLHQTSFDEIVKLITQVSQLKAFL